MAREQLVLNIEGRTDGLEVTEQAVKKTRARKVKTEEQKLAEKTSRARTMLVNKLALIHDNVQSLSSEGLQILSGRQEVLQFIEKIYEVGEVAIDTETSGFDCYTNQLAGLCLYVPGYPATYIPVGHIDLQGNLQPNQLQLDMEMINRFKAVFEDENIKQIYHNFKFDAKFLATNFDCDCAYHWDTLLAGHLLNENESHSLKDLWGKYCNNNEASSKFNDLFNKIDFRYVPAEDAYLYAAKDAKMTYDLYAFQRQYLNPDNPKLAKVYDLFTEIERPLARTLTRMELRGIAIDGDFSKSLSSDYNSRKDETEQAIRTAIANFDFSALDEAKMKKLTDPINLNSSAQMSILFYDVLGLPKVNKEKPNSTDAETLKKLIEKFATRTSKQGKEIHHFLTNISEYRALNKLLTSFIDSLPNEVNPVTQKIHAKNNAVGTVTGRMSMSGPKR